VISYSYCESLQLFLPRVLHINRHIRPTLGHRAFMSLRDRFRLISRFSHIGPFVTAPMAGTGDCILAIA